jgi:hypothetical protein
MLAKGKMKARRKADTSFLMDFDGVEDIGSVGEEEVEGERSGFLSRSSQGAEKTKRGTGSWMTQAATGNQLTLPVIQDIWPMMTAVSSPQRL